MHESTRQSARHSLPGDPGAMRGAAPAARTRRRAAQCVSCAGVLALLLAGGVSAQPDARIDPQVQRRPQIQIAPPNSNSAIHTGPLQAPPLSIGPPGQPASSAYAQQPAPSYRQDVRRLEQAAQPPSGYGSTRAAAEAAWTLGLLDLHGGVVPVAPRQAAIWFQRATQANLEPLAWAGVAWCAIDGCEQPPDPAAAQAAINRLKPVRRGLALYLQWLLDLTHKPITLAEAAKQPAGQKPDRLPESSLLRQAAAAGDANARNDLGIAAAARNDLAQARSYFKQAAAQSPAAQENLRLLAEPEPSSGNQAASEGDRLFAEAQRYHRGEGVPVNYAKALQLYQQAAAQGSLAARRMLELILSRPLPNGMMNVAWMAQLAQLDLSSGLPQFDPQYSPGRMRRDPTPLFELIPEPWRGRIAAARR